MELAEKSIEIYKKIAEKYFKENQELVALVEKLQTELKSLRNPEDEIDFPEFKHLKKQTDKDNPSDVVDRVVSNIVDVIDDKSKAIENITKYKGAILKEAELNIPLGPISYDSIKDQDVRNKIQRERMKGDN